MSQRISIKYINQSGAVDGETLVYNASLDEWVSQAPESSGLINWTETSGHILPNTNDTYDIGSSALKVRDIYMSGSTIHLGDQSISADADGIKMPSIKIGTGGNEISLTASSDGKLVQTAKIGGIAQAPILFTIVDLDDVTITSPTTGNVLTYDDVTSTWVNSVPTDSYTKPEVDTAISNIDLSLYDTSSEVDAKVASIVDSAPETLNTLNELASALGDDANHVATMTTLIGTKADVVHTHDLSAYDTSSEVDAKIANISTDAGSTVIVSDSIPVNPIAGDMWVNSSTMKLMVYYVDSTSSQWVDVSSPDGSTVNVTDSIPVNPIAGDMWVNSSTMKLMVYYVDSTSSQWVDVSSPEIDLSSYDTSSEVDAKIANISGVNLSDYDTSVQVDTKITNIPISKLNTISVVSGVSSILDSFTMMDMDSCKYIIKIKSDSGNKYITEILLLHDGTDCFISEYGIIDTSTNWVTLSSSIVGSNVELSIITTVNATVEITKIT